MASLLFYAVVIWIIFKLIKAYNGLKFDSFRRRSLNEEEAKYLIALLAKVAKSDGRVNELEAQLVSETLDDIAYKTKANREELRLIFNREKENLTNAYEIANAYRLSFDLDKQTAISRITFFLNLAFIDGEFSQSERNIIKDIARGFKIDDNVLNVVIYRFEKFYSESKRFKEQNYYNSSENFNKHYQRETYNQKSPYEILGVSSSVTEAELKKRYRELVRKYHPDILMGQGESEEVIERYTKKLQEINEAYESIRKEKSY